MLISFPCEVLQIYGVSQGLCSEKFKIIVCFEYIQFTNLIFPSKNKPDLSLQKKKKKKNKGKKQQQRSLHQQIFREPAASLASVAQMGRKDAI